MSEDQDEHKPVAVLKSDLSEFTKFHELLRAALGDLSLCESDPAYRIYMGSWHTPIKDAYCSVCLAGSVLAQHCGEALDMHSEFWNIDSVGGNGNRVKRELIDAGGARPYDAERYPKSLSDKMVALNAIREGFVRRALNAFYGLPFRTGTTSVTHGRWDYFNQESVEAEYGGVKIAYRSTKEWIDWPSITAAMNRIYDRNGAGLPLVCPVVKCCDGNNWRKDRDQFFADMHSICHMLEMLDL